MINIQRTLECLANGGVGEWAVLKGLTGPTGEMLTVAWREGEDGAGDDELMARSRDVFLLLCGSATWAAPDDTFLGGGDCCEPYKQKIMNTDVIPSTKIISYKLDHASKGQMIHQRIHDQWHAHKHTTLRLKWFINNKNCLELKCCTITQDCTCSWLFYDSSNFSQRNLYKLGLHAIHVVYCYIYNRPTIYTIIKGSSTYMYMIPYIG